MFIILVFGACSSTSGDVSDTEPTQAELEAADEHSEELSEDEEDDSQAPSAEIDDDEEQPETDEEVAEDVTAYMVAPGEGFEDDSSQESDVESLIEPGESEVQGDLPKRIVQNQVRHYRRDVESCYDNRLVESPELRGEVELQWGISAGGQVLSSEIAASTLDDATAEECLIESIEGWTFPEADGRGIVEVTYPFKFDVDN